MHKASKQVRADQSAKTQASRQSWREPACRRAFHSSLCSQNERRNRHLSRPQNYRSTQFTTCWCVMREGFAVISNLNKIPALPLFISVLSISYMHAASALFSWTMELWAFASSHFCTQNHGSLCPLHQHFVVFFRLRERSGRGKPHAE